MRTTSNRLAAWCLAGALAIVTAAAAEASQEPFANCHAQFDQAPDDYDSAFCFFAVARERRDWDAGDVVFDALVREHPGNFWLPLAWGHAFRDRDPERAVALYRVAADGFRASAHADGEVLARSNLRNVLFPRGHADAAEAEMARVLEIGATVRDPLLLARIWTLHATHVQDTGGDLGLAYRLLRQTERAIFPEGPYRLQRTCLTSLGLVAFRMGRDEEALAVFERLDRLAARHGDSMTQASARYNQLNTRSLRESVLPSPGAHDRLLRLAEQTLEAGMAAGHQQVIVKTHRTLAALLARVVGRQDEAVQHVRQCEALAVRLRQPGDQAVCAWLEALLLVNDDPTLAHAAQRRALRAAAAANNPVIGAGSASRQMQFAWHTRPRADAIRESLAMIDAIETLRRMQDVGESSAALFANWTLDYYWLVGRLLQDGADDIALAFNVAERLRARTLLDTLDRSRTQLDPTDAAVLGHRALLTDIAIVQRELMDPDLTEAGRQARLDALEQLELREQEAARSVALRSPLGSVATTFASLDEVQAVLADDEALLSYQVGIWETYEGEFGGGAWLIGLTRTTRVVHRIPDRSHLATMVPMFNGLLARDDRLGTRAAIRLYDDLVGAALADLGPAIRRLVVVPDGPLQRLPFGALRTASSSPPLAAQFDVTLASSATLWYRGRRTAPVETRGRALVLADPDPGVGATVEAAERTAILREGLQLGPLPFARSEGRAVRRHLGDVDVLVGGNASEHALKTRDLGPYALLHVAAHAVTDEARPERSAVLLAPGHATEDGLLQPREIRELNLTGLVVVLSACQTAAGVTQGGEGVLSLARAFLAAGARTVIGTRWPIGDAEAAAFFDSFYAALADGVTVSEALSHARRHAIDSGQPPSVWAGVELIGDGSARPFPDGRRRTGLSSTTMTLVAASAALVVLVAGLAVRAGRTRRASSATQGPP